jgi:hypothetical protein
MVYENDYSLSNFIEVMYKNKKIKLEKVDFYMNGILTKTHYYLENDCFDEYKQCVNCGEWLKADEGRPVSCYNKNLDDYVSATACSNCYEPLKKEADAYYNYLYHESLTKGYLDELLLVNTRMVVNSNYETDSFFFNKYQFCFLTGIKCKGYGEKKVVHFDHFIAIDTGHVGRIIGNIYPVHSKLNLLKSNKNPFEWIKEEKICRKIPIDKWNELINYFAHCYGLTPEEYKDFVYWCYANPRRIKDIEKDGDKTSIELWRKA